MFELIACKSLFLIGLSEMLDLVENVAEIAKITYCLGWPLASDEVCPEKIRSAEEMCRNRRENVLVLKK